MYSRQILQNKTAERRETATNKQEYKGKKLYILKKRKRRSAMSVTHAIFLMLAYRHEFVLQRLRCILKIINSLFFSILCIRGQEDHLVKKIRLSSPEK